MGIQARDQYGNAKTSALVSGQDFIVRVVRTSGTGMQGTKGTPPYYQSSAISTSPTVHGTFNTATSDGKYAGYYQVPSTPSPTGYTHYLYASWLAEGGVSATYYTGTSPAATTYVAPKDKQVDGSATNKRLTARLGVDLKNPAAAIAGGHGSNNLCGGDCAFIVRMDGAYKTASTQHYFKFLNIMGDGTGNKDTDRVRLWIDNKLIVDQWTSLDYAAPTGSYLFDSSSGIYDVHAEIYRKSGENTPKSVSIQDAPADSGYSDVPTQRLYFSETLSGSPYAVTVST